MNKISKKSMHEAADWLIRQQEKPLTDSEQKQLQGWLEADKDNQLAWQRAQHFINQVDTLPKDIAYAVLNRLDDATRRLNIGKLALLLASGPLIWGGYKTVDSQQWNADYRTAKGQQKQVTLPDGTMVKLNTATAFDISFNDKARLLSLREGEIQVHTVSTHSQQLPSFTIKTQDAILSPLDANFTVRQYSGLTRLGVIEGQVEASPSLLKNTQDNTISTGYQIELSSHGVLSRKALASETTSWLDNMLAVHNMPLNQFIREVSRYHRGLLRVSPDIENIDISGAFPLKNINTIFSMLSHTYPIQINSHLRNYWVTLEAV
ncbi:FecR domain-containing protein [Marinomonas rhizomae]|uniref:FecR domain-containing protein n=1 Tax=Marinomonas rhizomae TaxID=491948 RepID=UPI002106534D|nr:FecR domain-containing protein [Marinomonas rhizomae]UTV99978.1 FecR domain-containing protein [Marinomonas rhizomae]